MWGHQKQNPGCVWSGGNLAAQLDAWTATPPGGKEKEKGDHWRSDHSIPPQPLRTTSESVTCASGSPRLPDPLRLSSPVSGLRPTIFNSSSLLTLSSPFYFLLSLPDSCPAPSLLFVALLISCVCLYITYHFFAFTFRHVYCPPLSRHYGARSPYLLKRFCTSSRASRTAVNSPIVLESVSMSMLWYSIYLEFPYWCSTHRGLRSRLCTVRPKIPTDQPLPHHTTPPHRTAPTVQS